MKPCSHCHLVYSESALFKKTINGKEEYFCCKGCEGVFRILLESNLIDFYDKIGTTPLSPPKENAQDLAKFDSEAFSKKYIKTLKDNVCEVSLIIENIHCIACVWLNQKILNQTNGIYNVDINYTNNKAKIIFDKEKIALSEIIQKIRSVGYNAEAYDPKILENINAKERKNYYTRMIVGVFCTMNIMWIAVAQYSGYFLGMDRDIKDILNFAGFCLATPTLFFSGFIFFRSGYFGLKNGFINMDLLVSIGATLTYIYSIYASISRSGETYFESVAMIITFVLIGKFLEITTKKSAGDSIDKLHLSIPTVINVLQDNKSIAIAPQEVKAGDIILVRPGEKIIIDGILLSHTASIDSSMLTGESEIETKKQNDTLISGSINLTQSITYKATKCFEDSTLNNIINLIQDSLHKKPRIQTKANAISYHFSAFVLCCAIATFAFWAWHTKDFEKAMIIAVSVIIIACPCALALATPIATIIGITEAYKRKILFKEAKFLESFAKCQAIVFDKTGTLTFGKPKVLNEIVLKPYNKAILRDFISLNNHPISNGILEYLDSANANDSANNFTKDSAESNDFVNANDSTNTNDSTKINAESSIKSTAESYAKISDFKQITQKGIMAKSGDSILRGGSKDFLTQSHITINECEDDDNLKFYYAINGDLVAIFNLKDILKDNAKSVVSSFQKEHFRIIILSGDRLQVVKSIAKSLNISEFYHSQSPIDKSNFIDNLHKNHLKTTMIGDGINDAVALNKSDIAISMGKGSDIAIESSDIILLDDRLESLLLSYKISQKTYATIKQNIKISIIYNLLTIPLAMAGFIIPLFAALSMSFSSILVVLNSMRIKRGV